MSKKEEKKETGFLDEALSGCLGMRVKPSEMKSWLLKRAFDNLDRETRVTLNVNGVPGIGKTDIVKSLSHGHTVAWNGKSWDGFEVVDIPLGQIEEMGDILGFPVEEIELARSSGIPETGDRTEETMWVKALDSVISSLTEKGWTLTGNKRTTYAPPSWVPKEERPGILLFDDGNRASQRILRGIMQLIQDYRTISWSIPRGWTIVVTGNPDNGLNQVTSMDTAQMSRMKFITPVPDAQEWAVWATDHRIDPRLISFVLKYPEMMIGPQRTNPRTLAEFGRSLNEFPDLDDPDHYKGCLLEAHASLDEVTVETMMVFLQRSAELVIEPEDILERYDEKAGPKIKELLSRKEPRLDIINIMAERLYAHMCSNAYKMEKAHGDSLEKWLTEIPKDTAYNFMRRAVNSGHQWVGKLIMGRKGLFDIVKMSIGSAKK